LAEQVEEVLIEAGAAIGGRWPGGGGWPTGVSSLWTTTGTWSDSGAAVRP